MNLCSVLFVAHMTISKLIEDLEVVLAKEGNLSVDVFDEYAEEDELKCELSVVEPSRFGPIPDKYLQLHR